MKNDGAITYEVPEFLPMKGAEASVGSWDDYRAAERTFGLEFAYTATLPMPLEVSHV